MKLYFCCVVIISGLFINLFSPLYKAIVVTVAFCCALRKDLKCFNAKWMWKKKNANWLPAFPNGCLVPELQGAWKWYQPHQRSFSNQIHSPPAC